MAKPLLGRGDFVVAHLTQPSEKLWGVLGEITPAGVTLRGLLLASFEDFTYEVQRGEASAIGLTTMFVPLHRVERLFLDEPVGEVESYQQRFARRVGRPASELLVASVQPAPTGR